jgi:hypothetical protein
VSRFAILHDEKNAEYEKAQKERKPVAELLVDIVICIQ